jgi:hypothetical protein
MMPSKITPSSPLHYADEVFYFILFVIFLFLFLLTDLLLVLASEGLAGGVLGLEHGVGLARRPPHVVHHDVHAPRHQRELLEETLPGPDTR